MSVGIAAHEMKHVEVSELSTKTVTVRFDDGNLNSVTLFIGPDGLSAFAESLIEAGVEMLQLSAKDEPVEGVFSSMGIDGEPAFRSISKPTA